MQLESGTVVLIHSLLNLMLTIVMIYAWKASSRNAGMGFWAIGFAGICSGQIVFALYAAFRLPLLPALGFILHILGAENLVLGSGFFLNRPVPRRRSVAIILAAIFIPIFLNFFKFKYDLAYLVGSLAFSLILLRGSLLFFRHSSPLLGSMGKGTAVSLLSLSLLQAGLVVDYLITSVKFLDPLSVLYSSLYSLLLTGLALTLLQLEYARFHEELRIKAHEREVLLREMHHRTKNNLALVASMISLEAGDFEDEKTLEAFARLEDKIQTVALLHRQLQTAGATSKVRADEYLGMVADSASGQAGNISLEKEFESLDLESSRAIPLGLILNELVTNSRKHAFPGEREGHIRISLQKKDAALELIVSDNGVGMTTAPREDSLGVSLISTLASQLKGDFRYEPNGGTRAVLTIPAEA